MRHKLIIGVIILLFVGGRAFAQIGDPCPEGNCDPDVPITGLEWLLVIGGLFGAKRIYRNIKK